MSDCVWNISLPALISRERPAAIPIEIKSIDDTSNFDEFPDSDILTPTSTLPVSVQHFSCFVPSVVWNDSNCWSFPPAAPVSNHTEADLKNKDWVFINYTYKRFEGLTARGAIPSYMKSGKRWTPSTPPWTPEWVLVRTLLSEDSHLSPKGSFHPLLSSTGTAAFFSDASQGTFYFFCSHATELGLKWILSTCLFPPVDAVGPASLTFPLCTSTSLLDLPRAPLLPDQDVHSIYPFICRVISSNI